MTQRRTWATDGSGKMSELLAIIENADRLGPLPQISTTRPGGGRLFVLNSHDLVDGVLTAAPGSFDKGALTQRWRWAIGDGTSTRPPLKRYSGRTSIDISVGAWRRFRRRAMAQRLSMRRADEFRRIARDVAEPCIDRWVERGSVDLGADLREIVARCFARSFAPAHEPALVRASNTLATAKPSSKKAVDSAALCPYDKGQRHRHWLWQIAQVFVHPAGWVLLTSHVRLYRTFRAMSSSAARSDAADEGLYSVLARAAARYESEIPRKSMPDQMQGIFSAGTEPMATTLAWLLYHVAADPDLQAAAVASEVVAGSSLSLLEACIWETLRMHPPAWSLPRESLKEQTLGTTLLSGADCLLAVPMIQHYAPDTYPNALEFRPGRWTQRPTASGRFYPFGLGLRICPGMNYAVVILEALAREVLTRCELLAPEQPDGPRQRLGIDLQMVDDPPIYVRARVSRMPSAAGRTIREPTNGSSKGSGSDA